LKKSKSWEPVGSYQLNNTANVDGISRDQKIPRPKNPGILKPEKSRNKKSRDYEYIKIPGFLN
jgi:hypothetical protein